MAINRKGIYPGLAGFGDDVDGCPGGTITVHGV